MVIKMTIEHVSTMATVENIEEDGATLLQREDGYYATPGGGYIVKRGDAKRAAKALAKSNKGLSTPLSKLVKKTVRRLNGACSDTSVMSA